MVNVLRTDAVLYRTGCFVSEECMCCSFEDLFFRCLNLVELHFWNERTLTLELQF